mgnify:CR=1 FL=1
MSPTRSGTLTRRTGPQDVSSIAAVRSCGDSGAKAGPPCNAPACATSTRAVRANEARALRGLTERYASGVGSSAAVAIR